MYKSNRFSRRSRSVSSVFFCSSSVHTAEVFTDYYYKFFFFLLRFESVSVSAVTFMLFFLLLPCWTAVWQRRRCLSGQHRLFWRLWLSFKNNNPYFCCCIFISVMSLKARHSVFPPPIPQRSLVNQSNMFSSVMSLFCFWLYSVFFFFLIVTNMLVRLLQAEFTPSFFCLPQLLYCVIQHYNTLW